MIHELRIYECVPGSCRCSTSASRPITLKMWAKHGSGKRVWTTPHWGVEPDPHLHG